MKSLSTALSFISSTACSAHWVRNSMVCSVLFFSGAVFAAGKASSLMAPSKDEGTSGISLRNTEKSWAIEFSPVPLVIGMVNGEFSKAMNEHWTAGLEVNYWNLQFAGITVKSTGAALVGRYYFGQTYQSGWYASGSLGTMNVSGDVDDSVNLTEKTTTSGGGAYLKGLGGYGWFWRSFYMRLGGGLSYTGTPAEVKKYKNGVLTSTEANPKLAVAMEYNLGWSF